ncbi:hypothetical protein [Aeromonas molluscorum]|uniref:Uncharacterized protein n=1 Tax=Aeromonas molluscorum 848 TaxID=1268236 RepID=R1F4Q0_9GAMM|nr:hypothetical protein [Aeromonas molluscorum]EOD54843.1 hypothetical protein G113_12197 [Aeromonas molluscorum 848]
MTRTALFLLLLPLHAPADQPERWLVELEHNDGIHLQFQGAELELGSARVEGGNAILRPGVWLAIDSEQGVAQRIRPLGASWQAEDRLNWRRAQDRLLARQGDRLLLARLGAVSLTPDVRLINGLAADLQPGRQLVLSRNEAGRLTEILIPNPEDESE